MIQFSISEAWGVILSICGGIVTMAAVVSIVIRMVGFFRRPEQRQNTARVPPAVTVRVFSSSATAGRAPFAGLAGRASTFFTSNWSRATA